MRPADPAAVATRFRAVVRRGIARADRERAAELGRLAPERKRTPAEVRAGLGPAVGGRRRGPG
jgi:hypothetical protein